MWARPDLAQPIWMGRVRPTPKREEKIYWVEIGPTILGRYRPTFPWAELDVFIWAGPAHMF